MEDAAQLRRVNEFIEAALTQHKKSDKLVELRGLVSEKQRKLEELTNFVKDAKLLVSDFPNDAQVLKFERRVESLRDQIKQAERIASQHRAGIDAYHARLRANEVDMQRTLAVASEIVQSISALVEPLLIDEAKVVNDAAVMACCERIVSIMEERELELQSQCNELLERSGTEVQLANEATLLQMQLDQEIPVVEAEKDDLENAIRTEWAREQGMLTAILDKLYVVHREQAYHLQRGTHIKKEGPKLSALESEMVLSTRQSHLAAEVNRQRSSLAELKEELTEAKKLVETLRGRLSDQQREYERQRKSKEERLETARRRHAEAAAEGSELRSTKAELYSALHDVREIPHVTPRRQLLTN